MYHTTHRRILNRAAIIAMYSGDEQTLTQILIFCKNNFIILGIEEKDLHQLLSE